MITRRLLKFWTPGSGKSTEWRGISSVIEVTVDLSTGANNAFQIAVDPTDESPSWRMDARIVHGSIGIVHGSIEIVQAFRDGHADEGDRPHWMGTVIEEARTRLLERSA